MGNLPKEQQAAVKEGEGHDAKAPVKTVEVPQEPGPGQILVSRGPPLYKMSKTVNSDMRFSIGENQLDWALCIGQVSFAR